MARIPEDALRRADETPDEKFYRAPRLVAHIDDLAIAAVTQLYREFFPPGGELLDLMSSWVSHLPPEIEYRRVVGLGINEVELGRNPKLDAYVVQNLNTDPRLPFGEAEFDGAGICVSIDYLTRPVEVLREVGRVLRVGGPTIISFSNRCFPSKAVAIWHRLEDQGHLRLVESYLREAGNWNDIQSLDRSPRRIFSDPLYAVVGRSTGPYVEDEKRPTLPCELYDTATVPLASPPPEQSRCFLSGYPGARRANHLTAHEQPGARTRTPLMPQLERPARAAERPAPPRPSRAPADPLQS